MKKFPGKIRKSERRNGVVLCGAYGYGNAGDEAILEAIVRELRTLDPELPICVMTRKPRETEERLGVKAHYTFNIPAFCWEALRSRLYLNGGGSLIQDVTSRRSLWFYLLTISLAKRLGSKVLMYGCGIGPVKHPDDRKLAASIINKRVDAITLRDPVSKEELERMGVTEPEIIVAADPTVVLTAAEPAVVDELFRRWGMEPDGRYLGITVRPWAGFEAKASVFAAAADHAYHQHGLTPVFIPIERRRDVPAAGKVAELMTAPCHIMEEDVGTAGTLGVFGRMKAVVSMRLHALIFSASQGVPLVGVVYDPKVSAFLKAVGQDLYTDLEHLTAEALCAQIDAVAERIDDTELLNDRVARLRDTEHRNIDCAARLLVREGEASR